MSRPTGLLYSVDETPPPAIVALSALQHVAVNAITLVFPLIVAREADLAPAELINFVSQAMLALGVATILLCARWSAIGCGYLCPAGFSQIYVGPSIFALHHGGLHLALGMTAVAGAIQVSLSPLLSKLRALLPTEIAGLVIAVVGLSLAVYGVRFMLGLTTNNNIDPRYLITAGVTVATMIVLNIWTKGYTKLFCVLIGILVGYAVSALAGVFDVAAAVPRGGIQLLRIPTFNTSMGLQFDLTLLAPFAVAAIATTLRTMGDVSNAQRLNDKSWLRPDMRSLTGGVAANGVASLVSGIIGCCGVNSNSSSIGLSGATGVTSRVIGFATGLIFILLALIPGAAVCFTAMPVPVMGASLFFTSAFVFTSGLQMITTRLLDSRKIIVIGFSFAMAVVADVYRDVFANFPVALQPVFGNSLVVGTACAVLLNLIMRIGIRQRVTMTLEPGHVHTDAVEQFFSEQGASWAARRDVIDRAIFGVVQVLEVLEDLSASIDIEVSFDEFNLDVRLRYSGAPLALPERRPTPEEIIASADGARLLAGYLLRSTSDSISCKSSGATSEIQLHYDH